ncbi:tautomerase family protein [Rhodococcus globerulus]|uniref:Tautomerase family protein n=1 Tax=Rhodococcus globerulus TaxID=33008 RepID=A0ABU4C3W0_RHOGO|nr:tautomerase family protein [Rhodococcus globerulus]MDV6271190.1 tautomerase family protein [Rhodococcus globerulus]
MPHYQFFIQRESNSARRKTEIAQAFTEVHTRITGAPAGYVNCTFIELATDSIYVGGEPTPFGRMVGIIRQGRPEEIKRQLLTELAEAWSLIAQEPLDKLALFLHEIPGYQAMENGELLGEASEDHLLVDHV